MRLNLIQRLKPTKIYRPGMYKSLPKRLNWEQIEARPRQEGNNVVKGTSKRVVVVRSPDSRVFEQAIFIIREDFMKRKDNNQNDILREAQAVADHYIRAMVRPPRRRLSRIPPYAFAALGAVLAGAVWLALHLTGVM